MLATESNCGLSASAMLAVVVEAGAELAEESGGHAKRMRSTPGHECGRERVEPPADGEIRGAAEAGEPQRSREQGLCCAPGAGEGELGPQRRREGKQERR